MMHNTESLRLDIVHRLEFLITRRHNVSKSGSVSVSGEGKETPTLLGPLERANLNHWTI
jgi:hypothetical protein